MAVDASALDRLRGCLQRYYLLSGKTISDILDQKGNDLRIQLFRGFWAQKFGGGGTKKTGIAFRELARRAKAGIGTKVRLMFLDGRWGSPPSTDKRGRALSLWSQLVWQEATRRQQGIGVLAVSFLSKRFRDKRGERYLAENKSKTIGTLVRITKTADTFLIHGMTPGLNEISSRYGIKEKAMNAVSKDMEPYISRKLGEAAQKALN